MEQFWRDLAAQENDLFKPWGWGLLAGYFYQGALYDSENLFKFIEEQFSEATVRRHLNIGLADILSGQYHSFQDARTRGDFVKILQASLVFPGVFEPVRAFDSNWVSGSTIYESDVVATVNHCRHLGYADHDIVVDVVLSTNPDLAHVDASNYNAYRLIARSIELHQHLVEQSGVVRVRQSHPDVTLRHVIGPSRAMPNKIVPFQFTDEEVSELIRLGEADAAH